MSQEEEHLLDFNAAMRDFSIMFPTVSAERIEQVLRLHDGDVASTIDTLLRETQPPQVPPQPPTQSPSRLPPQSPLQPPSQLSPQLPPSYEEATSVPVYRGSVNQHELPNSHRQSVPTPISAPPNYARSFFASEPNTSQPAPVRRRESRTSFDNLSAERRRLQLLKRENERRLDQVTNEKEARILEDEQMALVLQQREIVRAERREPRSVSVAAGQRRRSLSKNSGPRVPEGPVVEDAIMNTDDLKNKLKKLSKVSRQRLVHLAARFRSDSSEPVF